jgi:hypothetical protein
MSGERHLLIPIHIDALVVAGTMRFSPFASAAPKYSKMQDEYYIGADLREPSESATLEEGIHLHFRLPPALAHKRSGGDFPRIPNRWLVQRYSKPEPGQSGSARLRTKAWLIGSDQQAPEDDKSAVALPIFTAVSGQEYDKYLSLRPTGVSEVFWEEGEKDPGAYQDEVDTPAQVELTAVTGGDAGFSAHYPACRSILGFCDKMEEVPNTAAVSYLVTGWYSGKKDDPWNTLVEGLTGKNWSQLKAKEKADINQWMDEYRCQKTFSDDRPLPAAILCHGLVRGVRWDKAGSVPIGHDPFQHFDKPAEYWADLGNTSAEAFGSRAAKQQRKAGKPVDRSLLEDLVTGFQTGLLAQGTGFASMDSDLHQQGFTPVAGGQVWRITAEKVTPGAEGVASASLSKGLQEKLDDLNRLEAEYDRRARRLRDYQWELYAVWHRLTHAKKHRKPKEVKELLNRNLEALQKFVREYSRQVSEAKNLRDKKIDGEEGVLKALERDYEDRVSKARDERPGVGEKALPVREPKYVLESEPCAPFYVPKDPVLLLSGPAMEALGTELRPDGALPCRVTGEELQVVTYGEERGNDYNECRAADLMKNVSGSYLKAIPPWAERLLGEALLLDKSSEMKSAPGPNGAYKDVKPKEPGVLPNDYGVFLWKHNPWIPIYGYWEVAWQNEFAVKVDRYGWSLDPQQGSRSEFARNTDLLAPDGAGDESSKELFSGLSFLAPPLIRLQDKRSKGKAKELLSPIFSDFDIRLRLMMSLTLGGLRDALIMRRAGDQLPPLSYDAWISAEDEPKFLLDEIGKVLGAEFRPESSPSTVGESAFSGEFCPLRVGRLQIQGLTVIDAFGQRFVLPTPKLENVSQSERLAPATEPSVPPRWRLRPRFCRPMRLEFTGIPGGQPVAGAPPLTPICGWVVLNHFDQNLMLYASNGRPAGILQKRFNEGFFYWVPVPGSNGASAAADKIENEHLRDFANFVLHLSPDPGAAFARLLDEAVVSTGQRAPEQNPAVSVLIGRPLALVRAELRFQGDGLPAFDQQKSWKARLDADRILEEIRAWESRMEEIQKQDARPGPAPPWPAADLMVTGNVEKVCWPIRLGDRRSAYDGLIGFFQGEPPSQREASNMHSHPFYSGWGFNFGNVPHEGLKPVQDLELDLDKKLQITLLMDPQARVHATSGVLPRVYLQLPAAELAAARQVREVFFQTAPVLGTDTTPHVPKPSDDYGQWSWAYRPNVTGWKEHSDMASAADLTSREVGWPTLTEGWLKLKIEPVRISGLWVERPPQPKKGDKVTIAWTVQGADFVELFHLPAGGGEKSVEKWEAGGKGQCRQDISEDTTFELRAWDKAGYQDRKQITIRVED